MLSDEFLVDLDYIWSVQRAIRLDFPVVASSLRPVSTPVSATTISVTCYNLPNDHSGGPEKISNPLNTSRMSSYPFILIISYINVFLIKSMFFFGKKKY